MSPLELFRRNQKVTMTALILLAMFSFVVLPAISSSLRQGGPGIEDAVLAEIDGVKIRQSRVGLFTQQHYSTVQFLRRLAEESMRRGATPAVPGFSVNQQTGQIEGIGINSFASEETSVRTLQFAAEAEAQGLELDDTSIELWLEQFTGGTLSDRDMFALLRQVSSNRMGQFQLYDMLRKQLLAGLYFQGSTASIINSSGQAPQPQSSPLDHWKNFLKLNQNASINAYGVLVNDYIDQTDANPTEEEIEAVYQQGKDSYPSEQSTEPGFRRRQTAKFEYLIADLESFRQVELEKLPEDQIKAEYERRVNGGAFALPDELEVEVPDEMPATAEAGDEAESETKSEDAASSESPEDSAGEMEKGSEDKNESEEQKSDDRSESKPDDGSAPTEPMKEGDDAEGQPAETEKIQRRIEEQHGIRSDEAEIRHRNLRTNPKSNRS